MKPNLSCEIDPRGLYTGAQAIAATGIEKRTFYRWVDAGKIPSHIRLIDNRRVYKGAELLKALTDTVRVESDIFKIAKRGRPKRNAV